MSNLSKIINALPENADGILITNSKNQYYATNFQFEDGYVFITRERSYLITDFRYVEAARATANKEYEIISMSRNRADVFKTICRDNKLSTVLFEDLTITVEDYETFKNIFNEIGVRLEGAKRLIEKLREFKEEYEIENIIKAQRIAEQAFEHILGFINYDRTEAEVTLELEFKMRSLGASNVSFQTIAVSGDASALPHGVGRNVKLRKGFFTMDFGAIYNGYCSDMTRTVVIGKADNEIKRIYNTVLAAQTEAINAAKEGITGAELDGVARTIINNAGFEGCFGHGLGHGVGLDIHEAPSVSVAGKIELTKGHVVTVEPGIYLEGKYGVRIEDMLVFTENGPINITKAPKNLIEI